MFRVTDLSRIVTVSYFSSAINPLNQARMFRRENIISKISFVRDRIFSDVRDRLGLNE